MSLIELLIAIFVLITVLTVASAAYVAGQKAWQKGNEINEITQNSRIAIDKLSRELRQTDEIITDLPSSEIEFQDGHSEELQYLRYYLDTNLLHRQTIVYEFEDIAVRWNIPGAEKKIKEDQIIAGYISSMQFSDDQLIVIKINDFSTKVTGRNIR